MSQAFIGSFLFHQWARPIQAIRGKLGLCDQALFLLPELSRYKYILCPDYLSLPIEKFEEFGQFTNLNTAPTSIQQLILGFTVMGVTPLFPLLGSAENTYLLRQDYDWYEQKCGVFPS